MQERFDRRRLLGYLGATGLALVSASAVSACGTTTRPTSTSHPEATTGSPPWGELAKKLSGRLVLPSDPDYLVSAQLYNERFDHLRPAAVAFCQSSIDVQHAVEFARRHEVPMSVRSGGHSYGGYSSGPGLVIDVSPMALVTVGPTTARVGAGTRLIDMYARLASLGRTVPGGSCPTVGIAGLALGGGIGVLGRQLGLTCDSLESLEMVSADSRLISADASDNPDLYWASRGGGGGNFGVVTSFEFNHHPLPELAVFTLEWPWAAAGDVLGTWQSWMQGAPDPLWSNCQLLAEASVGTHVRVTGVYCGAATALATELDRLIGPLGTPSYRFVGPEDFMTAMLIEAGCAGDTVGQCHLPSENPAGVLERSAFATKSLFVDAPLPEQATVAVVEAISRFNAQAPGLGGAVIFDSYGGAIAEIAPAATAFVHRRALASIEMSVSWSGRSHPAEPPQAAGWLAQVAGDLGLYASGAYLNYIDPTLSDWAVAYYGTNLTRLQQVKRQVDPDDVFRFAQSIPLSTPQRPGA
jgi:FAD/FMN-containing dehydrogenase